MLDKAAFSLREKVIIQFGGTGLLGRALMASLTAADATLVIASRNPTSFHTHTLPTEEVDIGDERSIQALRDRVITRYGKVDGIVFNAVSRPMASMADSLSAWKSSMETNATGFFATVRLFGDAMAARGSGSIVNIASIQGMVGTNPWLYEGTTMGSPPDYFFHKGGMINLTRYLASHYGSQGVRVNVVSPGGIFDPDKPQASAFIERYARSTMLGRMAEADEVGGAVVFLLSDQSSYITGVNLPVDGGYTSK